MSLPIAELHTHPNEALMVPDFTNTNTPDACTPVARSIARTGTL